uniref:WD_REPEATS_REGION domain-containing protein n=1 Tax=Caenorhabditis japonica TaxID=281687 RepID=A0A8R1HW07_CAEJA
MSNRDDLDELSIGAFSDFFRFSGEVSRIKGPKSFTSIDIHPTSHLLISSCTDAVPRLYDPKNRDGAMVKQSFIGHQTGWVTSVKWNPVDANQFVSVSTDKTAKMWDVRPSAVRPAKYRFTSE